MKESQTINPKMRPISIKLKGQKRKITGKTLVWAKFDPYRIDKRKDPGRMIDSLKTALLQDIGPSPTVDQLLLVKRIVMLYLKAVTFDQEFIKTGGHVTAGAFNQYIACENAIRRNLSALGIDRKSKRKVPLDLNEFLKSKLLSEGERERPS
jgi:hypothetical protein